MEQQSQVEAVIAPYWELLRVSAPWEVRATLIDYMRGRLEYELGWSESAPLKCPECARECPLHDVAPERKWRYLGTKQVLVIVRARVPRCHCSQHGIKAVSAPWLEPMASYAEHHVVTSSRAFSELAISLRQTLLQKRFQRLYLFATRILRPIADTVRRPLITQMVSGVQTPVSTVTLPIDPDPPYKAYHANAAHPLSILGSLGDLKSLLASEYINFSCATTPSPHGSFAAIVPWRTIGRFVSLGYCELFERERSLSFRMTNSRHLIQWMVDRIGDKWYLLSHVNKYYVPCTWAHLKGDFLHDCLIFGCDTEKRVFKVATYLDTGEYGVTNVSFTYMAMAMTLRGSKYFANVPICHVPVILAVRPKPEIRIPFDRRAACENLNDYLHSAPPDEGIYACDDFVYAGDWMQAMSYPTLSRSYGLQSFTTIVTHIRQLVTQRCNVDMRDTRALWEHKKIMYSNMNFWGTQICISNVDNLTRSYKHVVNWAHSLHWMCLAYNQDNRRDHRELVLHLDNAGEVIDIEKKILTQCYWKLGEIAR